MVISAWLNVRESAFVFYDLAEFHAFARENLADIVRVLFSDGNASVVWFKAKGAYEFQIAGMK